MFVCFFFFCSFLFAGVSTIAGRYPGMVKENQDGFFVFEHEDKKDLVAGVLDGHGVNGRQV